MMKDMEKSKEEMKEKINQAVDEYCERFARASEDEILTIDRIEQLWGEAKEELHQILADTTQELA